MLLLGSDIESNPGPPVTGKIQKVVLGTLHQGHAKFGDTAGYNAHVMRFMQYVSP